MDLSDPGTEPWSLALQEDSLPSEPPGKPLDITYCQTSQRRVGGGKETPKIKQNNWIRGLRMCLVCPENPPHFLIKGDEDAGGLV